MERKPDAGAEFAITNPVIEKNQVVEKMLKSFDIPVVVEAWIPKKLHLLSECAGYEIPENTGCDLIANLEKLKINYPDCSVYLALLNYKRQFPLLKEMRSYADR